MDLPRDVGPLLAYFAIRGAVHWLTMDEDKQASLVGLELIIRILSKHSHPIVYKSSQCISLYTWPH